MVLLQDLQEKDHLHLQRDRTKSLFHFFTLLFFNKHSDFSFMGLFGKIGNFFHHAWDKVKSAGHSVGKFFSRGAGKHIVSAVQNVADTAASMGSKRGMAVAGGTRGFSSLMGALGGEHHHHVMDHLRKQAVGRLKGYAEGKIRKRFGGGFSRPQKRARVTQKASQRKMLQNKDVQRHTNLSNSMLTSIGKRVLTRRSGRPLVRKYQQGRARITEYTPTSRNDIRNYGY